MTAAAFHALADQSGIPGQMQEAKIYARPAQAVPVVLPQRRTGNDRRAARLIDLANLVGDVVELLMVRESRI